jgi:DNA-binding response OmpR family regulator
MASILVIDDDTSALLIIDAILQQDGHEVACATDGRLGIRTFKEVNPDLAIIDIFMPTQEGIQTIIELRTLEPAVPIIAMSVDSRCEIADFLTMSLKLGASEILRKPFDRQKLRDMVRMLLRVGVLETL